ncbi:hypothetical protein GUITHDRAFT_107891 [Guillardia theta CCMP2712]|uniref:Zn(2)-C6 fungal-type domain-containing protein n=1 Tax=Guillardia theta (strain CCMP2712) TaxID=905079 RepID=L1JDU8_GUITC|nr:hypothetical protein GUITHDRAFT_107891 [Guillardia theta CCMP2712]EKX46279.1 hypothetical protein GUITHDRAFT_107891 [Guillardia theta CCMP2712]|eukprot:XP_005833259.1 hypothetical protein GUITHDRAFT_107891 [Guillardia theta CCMP2712]
MRRWLSSRRHPTKSACLVCRSAKTKCDETRPCTRCVNKGLTCSELPPSEGGFDESSEKPEKKSTRSRGSKLMRRIEIAEIWEREASSLLDEALRHVLSEFD